MSSSVRVHCAIVLMLVTAVACGRRRVPPQPVPTEEVATKFWVTQHQRADRIARQLRIHLGPDGLRVSFDRIGHQVVTTGSPALTEHARDIISNLDIETYISDRPVYSYRLVNRRAVHWVLKMRDVAMQLARHRAADPHDVPYPAMSVHADEQSNTLIFCGLKDDFHALKEILDEMDLE